MLKITNNMEEISKDEKAIVAFTATWCNPCKQMKPHFAKVAVLDKDNAYYVVDIDEINIDWINKLNIKSVPQILELKNGNLNKIVSSRTYNDIIKELGLN